MRNSRILVSLLPGIVAAISLMTQLISPIGNLQDVHADSSQGGKSDGPKGPNDGGGGNPKLVTLAEDKTPGPKPAPGPNDGSGKDDERLTHIVFVEHSPYADLDRGPASPNDGGGKPTPPPPPPPNPKLDGEWITDFPKRTTLARNDQIKHQDLGLRSGGPTDGGQDGGGKIELTPRREHEGRSKSVTPKQSTHDGGGKHFKEQTGASDRGDKKNEKSAHDGGGNPHIRTDQ